MASLGVINANSYTSANGVTDDSVGLQAAITDCGNQGGGTVLVPDGIYKITTPIVVPVTTKRGLSIQGAGMDATQIVYSGSGHAFQIGAATLAAQAQGQWIRDLMIDMSGSGTPTGGALFKSSYFGGLERVHILGPTGGNKILVYFDPGDGTLQNFHNTIRNCFIRGQTTASDVGVKLHSTTSDGANSNWVRDNWFGVFNQSILIDGGDSNRITGNEFNGSTNTAVKLQSANTVDNMIIENRCDGPTNLGDVGASVARTSFLWNSGGAPVVDAGLQTVHRSIDYPPVCAVRRTTNQTITTATITALGFATEMTDPMGMHDNVTNNTRITVPNDGVYAVSGQVLWTASSGGTHRAAFIRKNGSSTDQWGYSDMPPANATINPTLCPSVAALPMNRGDYVELCVIQDTGVGLDVVTVANSLPSFHLARVDA